MKVEVIAVGFLRENCYIVTQNDKSIIIDPGDEAEKIIDACKDKNVVGILLTHRHFDHVGALKKIEEAFDVKVSLYIDGFSYEVIETPGHTKDSLTYYFKDEGVMFTGDFLFKGTIGRMDLPTGSKEDMEKSLEKVSHYPKSVKVYPGHGDSTVLGDEIPYFKIYLKES